MPNQDFNIGSYKGLVIYEVGGINFCSDLQNISGIHKVKYISIPKEFQHNIFSPVIIDHKEFLLVNLSLLLNLKDIEITPDSRLLQYDPNGKNSLYLVGKINLIVTIDSKFLETIKIMKSSITSDFIIGAFDYGSGEIMMLDLNSIWESYNKKIPPKK